MREIVFDTETTGLNPDHIDPAQCDRIVEVGCIELFNYLPTGREFQMYINPGRPVSEATVRITVLGAEANRAPLPDTLQGRVLSGGTTTIDFQGFGVDPDFVDLVRVG